MLGRLRKLAKRVLPAALRNGLRRLVLHYMLRSFYFITFRIPRGCRTWYCRPLNLILHREIEEKLFVGLQDYSQEKSANAAILYRYPTLLCYSEPRFMRAAPGERLEPVGLRPLVQVDGYARYGVALRGANLVGGSNLVLVPGSRAIYFLKEVDRDRVISHNDFGVKCYNDKSCLVSAKKTSVCFDKAIGLVGNHSDNYYHLLFDILARLQGLEELGIESTVPLLVDEVCLRVPQFAELIELMNESGREVIGLEKGCSYKVGTLYHTTCPNIIPPNFYSHRAIRAHHFLFSLSALEFLRSRLMRCCSEQNRTSEFPKRIYLTRKKASVRRRFNESEVYAVLTEYGFQQIAPEDYSISEQVRMFNGAEMIAGGSGAAFSNLLFCKPPCKILVFVGNDIPISIFSTIARFAEVDLLYLKGTCLGEEKTEILHDAFNVSKSDIRTAIDRLLS